MFVVTEDKFLSCSCECLIRSSKNWYKIENNLPKLELFGYVLAAFYVKVMWT